MVRGLEPNPSESTEHRQVEETVAETMAEVTMAAAEIMAEATTAVEEATETETTEATTGDDPPYSPRHASMYISSYAH